MTTLVPTFNDWTSERDLPWIGTNAGARVVPFQSWKRFKEAFAPELIREAFQNHGNKVDRVLDPFGGSGTTALASQFLGAHPITAEVNPYLADVIEAKLTSYESTDLLQSLTAVVAATQASRDSAPLLPTLPATFLEPGIKGRYLYPELIGHELLRVRWAIESLEDRSHVLFFRTMLSAILISFSNVTISGKGRRYRGGWEKRNLLPDDVLAQFISHSRTCIDEVKSLGTRSSTSFDVLRGDSRAIDLSGEKVDLVIFSPPYPNSFDYTDVYNIELWMLGYLRDSADNKSLRSQTLSSHVQIKRNYTEAPSTSDQLLETLQNLRNVRATLWNRDLPDMVGAYFYDLNEVIRKCQSALKLDGEMYIVVGDSRYGGVDVPVADILAGLAAENGLKVLEQRPFRSMRSSPQQGGRLELPETLLRFRPL